VFTEFHFIESEHQHEGLNKFAGQNNTFSFHLPLSAFHQN